MCRARRLTTGTEREQREWKKRPNSEAGRGGGDIWEGARVHAGHDGETCVVDKNQEWVALRAQLAMKRCFGTK